MSFQPLFFKNVDLVLGDDGTSTQFKCQVKSCKLVPSVSPVTETTACPSGQYSEVPDATWTLDVGVLAGRDTENPLGAFQEFCRANSGLKTSFAFRPWSGDHQGGYKGVITIVPLEIGGEVGGFSTPSASFSLDGQPEPLTAAEAGADTPAGAI